LYLHKDDKKIKNSIKCIKCMHYAFMKVAALKRLRTTGINKDKMEVSMHGESPCLYIKYM